METPWLYDERKQVGTNYADESNVKGYDAGMQRLRSIPQEVEGVAQALSLSRIAAIWEIGCGTGEMALGLAARCRQVYASDVSPAMISLARKKAGELGIENVALEEGGFLFGFAPPEPVDAVVSQLTLHHLPDFWKLMALRRVASYLKPNGKLFLRDVIYPSGVPDYDAYFAGLIGAIRKQGGDELASQTIAHIKDEHSTFAWVIEEMLKQAGFVITDRHADRFTTSYTCVKQGR